MREFLTQVRSLFRRHWKVEDSHAPALVVALVLLGSVIVGMSMSSNASKTSTVSVDGSSGQGKALGIHVQAQTPKMVSSPNNFVAGGKPADLPSSDTGSNAVLGENTTAPQTPAPAPVPSPPPTPQPPTNCKYYKDKQFCEPICKPCSETNKICPLDASPSVRNPCTICHSYKGEAICYPSINH